MAVEGPGWELGFLTASADLSGSGNGANSTNQFLAVDLSGSLTVNLQTTGGGKMLGVLQNTPANGQAADIRTHGFSKAVAGAAITAGAEVMVNASAQFVTWASGSQNAKVGRCLETVSGSGQVFLMEVYSPVLQAPLS